jgi:hypothetical protein
MLPGVVGPVWPRGRRVTNRIVSRTPLESGTTAGDSPVDENEWKQWKLLLKK